MAERELVRTVTSSEVTPASERSLMSEEEMQAAGMKRVPTIQAAGPSSAAENVMTAIEIGTQAVGGFVGGAATPAFPPTGAAVGSIAARGVTEAVRPFVTGETTETLETFKRMVVDGFLSGLFETGARYGVPALRRSLTRPFRSSIDATPTETAGIQRTREIMQTYGRQAGGYLRGDSPADLAISQILGEEAGVPVELEKIVSSGWISGRRAGRFFVAQAKAISAFADDIANRFGTAISRKDAVRTLINLADGNYSAAIKIRKGMYDAAREVAGEAGDAMSTKEIVGAFKDAQKQGGPLAEIYDKISARLFTTGTDELGTLGPVDKVAEKITGKSTGTIWRPEVDIDRLRGFRTSLMQMVREAERSPDPQAAAIKRTANFLVSKMNSVIGTLPLQARRAYHAADEAVKGSEEMYNNRVIRALTKRVLVREQGGDPTQLPQLLLRSDRPGRLEVVKNALGEDAFNNVVRPQLANYVRDNIVDPTTRLIDGKALLRLIGNNTREGGLGTEVVNAAFGPELMKAYSELGQAAVTAAKRPGVSVFIKLAQAGAATEILLQPIQRLGGEGSSFGGGESRTGRGVRMGSYLIVFGPSALGRVLFNPKGIRALTDTVSATTPNAVTRAFAQLLAAAVSQAVPRQQQRAERKLFPEGFVEVQ